MDPNRNANKSFEAMEVTIIRPQCRNCVFRTTLFTCKAYPEGIPQGIYLNEVDHRRPYPGDNDIQYFPMDPAVPHPLADTDSAL